MDDVRLFEIFAKVNEYLPKLKPFADMMEHQELMLRAQRETVKELVILNENIRRTRETFAEHLNAMRHDICQVIQEHGNSA